MMRGSLNSKILVLGEAPGQNEMKAGRPFVGASGQELGRMLAEAGIAEDECLFANVCNLRPENNNIEVWMPTSKKAAMAVGAEWHKRKWCTSEIIRGLAQLEETINSMPNLELVLPLGNVPLWAVTDEWGITKWRGSQIKKPRYAVVPTYHPAAVLRMWDWRWIAVEDFKRAREWMQSGFTIPEYNFLPSPTYDECLRRLHFLLDQTDQRSYRIAVDIETRSKHIACLGIAHTAFDAICIPFMTVTGSYFREAEEIEIVRLLYRLLTHPNIEVIGQNFLYDQQYIARRLGFKARLVHDTMVKHHLCFPGVSKGLDFISSMYNKYHCYWKDESKDWDPKLGEEQLWVYNCKDACATYEANEHLDETVKAFRLEKQLDFQMKTAHIAFDMMLRGIAIDLDRKQKLHENLEQQLEDQLTFIKKVTGISIEPSSPKQVQSFCYDVLRLPPVYKTDKKRGIRRLTADKEAIDEWIDSCEPLYRPVLQAIADYRSLRVYDSTFAQAPLDHDGRFRCSINVAGPETFRWSTSEDAFGFGTNMQNIPRPEED